MEWKGENSVILHHWPLVLIMVNPESRIKVELFAYLRTHTWLGWKVENLMDSRFY